MTTGSTHTAPRTLPITVAQYRLLVEHGHFADRRGQVELIRGRLVEMNPQGPRHADPVDELGHWSHMSAGTVFRIRIEKPVEIPGLHSTPEPDIAWATRRRYVDRHPGPEDIHLLIEVSGSSKPFDCGEKRRLYAEAGIAEYWIVDIAARTIEIMTRPIGAEYQQTTVHGPGDTVSPRCMPTAVLPVAQLFSDSSGI